MRLYLILSVLLFTGCSQPSQCSALKAGGSCGVIYKPSQAPEKLYVPDQKPTVFKEKQKFETDSGFRRTYEELQQPYRQKK